MRKPTDVPEESPRAVAKAAIEEFAALPDNERAARIERVQRMLVADRGEKFGPTAGVGNEQN